MQKPACMWRRQKDAGQLSTVLGAQFLLERKETEHGGCFVCMYKETAESSGCYFRLESQHNSNFKCFFSSFDAFPVTYSRNIQYPKKFSNTFPVTYSRNIQYPTKFSNLRGKKEDIVVLHLKPILNNLRIACFVHIFNYLLFL